MSIFSKVKAGVLPFVIIISLVVSMLCSAIILLFYYHQIFIQHYQHKQKLRSNALSGMYYAMATMDELPAYEEVALDLFGLAQDSVSIYREPWGVFDIVKVNAYREKDSNAKAALIGSTVRDDERALYLTDMHRPLSVAGNTLIRGNASLPKAGVKAEYVNRIPYSRNELIYGSISNSQASLPALHSSYRERIQRMVQPGFKNMSAHFYEYSTNKGNGTSFLPDSTARYMNSEGFVLKGRAEGKIIFRSEKEIRVTAQSELKDIILIAPKIIIEDFVQGRFQAFAKDTIILGEGVFMQYPSTICVFNAEGKGLIDIGSFSKVHGLVSLLSGKDKKTLGLVKIQEEAEIVGQLFAEGFVQHQGTVKGTLSCHKFFLKTTTSLYENYLLNGIIDRTKLPIAFVGSPMLNPLNEKQIVSWLY